MPLPPNFQFSQGSLQDFVDCRRRFFLRYIWQLAWPAAQSEPLLENERAMLDGALFHRMIQQYLLGIPLERLSQMALGEGLQAWWDNFTASKASLTGVDDHAYRHSVEYSLSAPLAGARLVAKYDLVAAGPQGSGSPPRFWLYDWKTSRFRTRRSALAGRLQTRVYPFLLALSRTPLSDGLPVHPDQIEMVYWFAGFPDQPEHFPYSLAQFSQDQDDLTALIQSITRLAETSADEDFPLTPDEKKCTYCVYRSLCNRGLQAGEAAASEAEATEDLPGFDLDFDQVAEVEF